MTIRIFAADPAQSVPLDISMELRCDGRSLFCIPPALFPCNWYPDAASAAFRGGWSMTAMRQLGPCCSGRRP